MSSESAASSSSAPTSRGGSLISDGARQSERVAATETVGKGEGVGPVETIPQSPNEALALYRSRLETYITSDELYTHWTPPKTFENRPAWNKAQRQCLAELHIPKLENFPGFPSLPDILLHRLGAISELDPGYNARIDDFMSGSDHILLVNASGTGKTRLVFETLTRVWGFYFTCARDLQASPYGSSDLSDTLRKLARGFQGRITTLFVVPPTRFPDDFLALLANRVIAEALFRRMLLARYMVFELFQTLLSSGLDSPHSGTKWLLLQLRSTVILGDDIFSTITHLLWEISDDEVYAQISRLSAHFADLVEFVAVDEAQVASATLWTAFTNSDGRVFAPVLRELVISLHKWCPRQRFIVSGTSVKSEVLSEALQACRATRSFQHFYILGQFDTLDRTVSYLKHFLADYLSDDQYFEAFRWMRGRHRFMTVFVYHILTAGPARFEAVLDLLVSGLTGHERSDEDADWIDDAPYNLIVRDSFLEYHRLAPALRDALFTFALKREATTFSQDALNFARIGLGILGGQDASATVSEPLVFYRLLGWVAKSKSDGIEAILNRKLKDDSILATGISLAAGVAAYLWNTFSASGCRLADIARFEGPSVPYWATEEAVVVLPPLVRRRGKVRKPNCTVPEAHSITGPRTPDETAHWLCRGKTPFLIPDDDFDADLLFFLRLHSGDVLLVLLHLEPFSRDRPRRMRTIVPPDPATLYSKSRTDRDRVLSALKALPPVYMDRQRQRPVRYNILHLICFTRAYRQDYDYNPPVARLDFARVLQHGHAPELEPSLLDAASLETAT